MPPTNDANGSSTPLHKRKQSVPARVVPAIPLALSKPKQPRQQAQLAHEERAGAQLSTKQVATGNVNADGVDKKATARSGDGPPNAILANGDTPASTADTVSSVDTPESHGSAPMSVSTGDTPEPSLDQSAGPKTPPLASTSSPTITMSPPLSSHPTDRFDIRHIRTELPPAFIPSAERTTPQSASSSGPQAQTFPTQSHAHPSHPSTSSIIFGGPYSSTSSPAPPQSAGSGSQPPPHPTVVGTQPPYFVPSAHSHHASEPYAPRIRQPGFAQQQMAWSMRQDYMPPSPASFHHSHAHMPFRYPPRETFSPQDSHQANGNHTRSRSVSQASSAAVKLDELPSPNVTDYKAVYPSPPHLRHQFPNGQIGMQPLPHPDVAASLENAEALRDHIMSHFSHPSLADCHLQILEDDGGRLYLDCHKMILSRSSTLFDLVQSSEAPASATLKMQVHVRLKGRYLRTGSFMDCLRYLYGGRLLPLDQSRWPENTGATNEQRVEKALQYIATGAWLKVPVIASRGVEVAASLLHWDTLSTALAFALDGGLSQIWSVDDGSEDKFSCSSSDDSLSRESVPTYDPYATQLLHRIVHFAAHMFPPNFYLDASAPQLERCPRLPTLPAGHQSRPSRTDPRLSQIRFGEMFLDDHQRPSPVTTTISSMLLSLPFAILKCLLEHFDLAARLGPDTVGSIMRQVVAEREARRLKALKARTANHQDDTADAQLAQNLYWEESVEPSAQHRAGFRLARRKRGIDTPPSSGAGSERNK